MGCCNSRPGTDPNRALSSAAFADDNGGNSDPRSSLAKDNDDTDAHGDDGVVLAGEIRGGGCKHTKETTSGGGGAAADSEKSKKKLKKRHQYATKPPAAWMLGPLSGGGGASEEVEFSEADEADESISTATKKLVKPPLGSLDPELIADIEHRLAKAEATEAKAEPGDGSSTAWPSWRTDAIMVELPNGTKFDVNSTVDVLTMLVADEPALGNDICRAILVILDQKEELDEQRRYVEEHGGAAPPEVIAVAKSSAFDAFGVVVLKCVDLEQQLKELDKKPTFHSSEKDDLRKPLDAELEEQTERLVAAHAGIASWGLEVDHALAQLPIAAFEGLPIAARQGETTMQTVVGRFCMLFCTFCCANHFALKPNYLPCLCD
jgi:hypothetical protein